MFAAAALTMGALAVALQLTRVIRGHKLGVSAATWLFLTVMQSGWAAFYYTIDQPWLAIVSLLFTPFTVAIAAGVLPQKRKPVALTVAAAATLVAAVVFAGPVGEATLGLVASLAFLPQVVVVLKSAQQKTSLDGVSKSSWAWTTIVTVLWLTQGIIFREPTMIAANVVLLASCVTILGVTATQPKRIAAARQH